MATLKLKNINKIYDHNVQAVFDFNLDVEDRELVVLVGPSGCGKTTILRIIAGLENSTSGMLYIDDKLMNHIDPKDRDVAMVFQSYALYPHMSVYDNIAFGLNIKKISKEERDKCIKEVARILEIEPYLNRGVRELSGGQRQRVTLGRAIVHNARILLFDEPLSSLDTKLRIQMRSEIIKLHERIKATTVYVTHDQSEAMSMATKIVVMKEGCIQQIGTPFEVYNNPSNMFVAEFIGSSSTNFLRGYIEDCLFICGNTRIPLLKKHVDELKGYDKKEVILGVRPEDIHEGNIDIDSCFDFEVEIIEFLGHEYIIHGFMERQPMSVKVSSILDMKKNSKIKLIMDLEKIHFYDPETEVRVI